MQNESNNNPLLCDPETGSCEIPFLQHESAAVHPLERTDKPLKVIYFTDPICSSCWGIEPQLRKLKLEYGDCLSIHYHMGGLLPDWNYNSGGISKPSDVAGHWDEVSIYYDMPIDGDIWLEDPLHSSYPPSIAFKAAQLQDTDKAILFLRTLREMVFLQKKNIAKWEYIAAAAKTVGLDEVQLLSDFEGPAFVQFEDDLKLAGSYGVRGFPTLYFEDLNGNREMVYGTKPYTFYEAAILKLNPPAVKGAYSRDWKSIFSRYNSLTAKEYALLTDTSRSESEQLLNDLTANKLLIRSTTKNGAIWHVIVS
jgi:predicted DsbA family dithiol-disulfide isomerase